jgi:hypothetical protein
MSARDIDPAEEVFGDLAWYRSVVWCEWNVRCDATKRRRGTGVSVATGKKKKESVSHL